MLVLLLVIRCLLVPARVRLRLAAVGDEVSSSALLISLVAMARLLDARLLAVADVRALVVDEGPAAKPAVLLARSHFLVALRVRIWLAVVGVAAAAAAVVLAGEAVRSEPVLPPARRVFWPCCGSQSVRIRGRDLRADPQPCLTSDEVLEAW